MVDAEITENRNRKISLFFTKASLLVVFLVVSVIYSTFIGSVTIPVQNIASIYLKQIPFFGNFVSAGYTYSQYEIVVLIREPEVLAAVVVGAALAIGGTSVQSVFRNPITEPYIIGISSGATLGAVIALATSTTIFGAYSVQFLSFFTSIAVVFVVYFLSFRTGRVPPIYLLLTGIAISLFISALVGLILFSSRKLQNEAFAWLLGSLSGITWQELGLVTLLVMISSLILGTIWKELDALQMGEPHARSIGVNVEKTKLIALTVTTVGVSAAVSISGLIGFVGLVIPHLARIVFGGSNRKVLPMSALFGGIFLLISDDLARTLVHNEILPVGIITGLIGVPFFMYMLSRISRGNYVS
jgi:iron complex transport system permease protein